MNTTQRSRYSSAENSGYDGYEDDFEVDAGDELDGELEVDVGQAEEGDNAGQSADQDAGTDAAGPSGGSGTVPGGGHAAPWAGAASTDDEAGSESRSAAGAAASFSSPSQTNHGGGGGRGDSASYGSPPGPMERLSLGGDGEDDERDEEPVTHTTPPPAPPSQQPAATPGDAPLSGSPISPSPPALPPLNPTVSPYLARTASYEDAPAPPPRPPAAAPTPAPAPSTASASAPTAVRAAASRPITSRGPGSQSAAAASPRPAAQHQQHQQQQHQQWSQHQEWSQHQDQQQEWSQHQQHHQQWSQQDQQHKQWSQQQHQRASSASPSTDPVPALSLALLQQASAAGAGQQQQQLAAAIRHSVDVLRASEQMKQLQSAVEALTSQAVAAERGRAAAEAGLVELTQRMQEQEKRLNDSWESKLMDKQREVQQLRTKVAQLESQGVKGRLNATGTANARSSQQAGGISLEEAAALRKELQETEVLIRGYQLENEAATRRIKELEEAVVASQEHAAERVLRSERAALLARDDVGRRNVDTASKLARVLALEKELAGVKEEATTRESELRSQLEKLRAEKKSLEAKSGGVDLKAMADGDVLVKQLREEMDSSRAATQALIQEMQAKLAWYAENQELLTKNDALVSEQRDIIQQLQARLAAHEGAGAGAGSNKGPAATRAATAQARVRELEAQVEQLHKALRGRAPANSLAAVVAAARPTAEENALLAELRDTVEELSQQLQVKDEDHERQLRSHLQQLDRLKAQYSERAGRLDAATKNRGRVKELERQLEEQKGIFGRRVRELEARLKAGPDQGAAIPLTPAPGHLALAAGPPPSAAQTPTKGLNGAGQAGAHGGSSQGHHPPQPPSSVAGGGANRRDDLVPASHLRAREMEVKKLTADLERRSKQVSELHLKLGEAESRVLRLTADLRRSHAAVAAGQSPLPSRARHEHLPHDDRPVGPSRDAAQQLFPSGDSSGGGADDSAGSSSRGGGRGGGRNEGGGGGRAVSSDLVEKLEERCGNLTVENGSLRGQVAALGRQLAAVRQELEEMRASGGGPGASASAADAALVTDLRRKLDAAELALTTVQRGANDAAERGAMAAAEHQRAMLRLHDEVAYREGLKWQERLATLEQELRSAHQRCEQMEAELAVTRSRGAGGWTPEAAAFASMERRLDEMAREMAQREAKWRAVLQDTQSLHGVQWDMERRKWESTLEAKEAEVQATRSELQSLLTEVAAVQELQSRAAAQQQQRAVASRAQQLQY